MRTPQWEGPSPPRGTRTDHTNYNYQDAKSFTEFSNSSRQVTWETVHEYVQRVVATVGFPMVGTPSWSALSDDDPRKLAAIYSAAEHWALYIENNQRAMAEASCDVSTAADWSQVALEIQQRNNFYAEKPYLKRVAS